MRGCCAAAVGADEAVLLLVEERLLARSLDLVVVEAAGDERREEGDGDKAPDEEGKVEPGVALEVAGMRQPVDANGHELIVGDECSAGPNTWARKDDDRITNGRSGQARLRERVRPTGLPQSLAGGKMVALPGNGTGYLQDFGSDRAWAFATGHVSVLITASGLSDDELVRIAESMLE